MYWVWKKRPLRRQCPCDKCSATGKKPRYSLVAVIVANCRVSGKPVQRHVARLPSIRSCCLRDKAVRREWWKAVEKTLKELVRRGRKGAGRRYKLTEAEANKVRFKLALKVPRPRQVGSRRAQGRKKQESRDWRDSWESDWQSVEDEIRAQEEAAFRQYLRILDLSWPCRPDEVKAA